MGIPPGATCIPQPSVSTISGILTLFVFSTVQSLSPIFTNFKLIQDTRAQEVRQHELISIASSKDAKFVLSVRSRYKHIQ